METLQQITWPIIAFSGIGGFIDFLIGKAGQERARGWLLKWWVRFDDVTRKNFGLAEATLAKKVLDALIGRRFYSPRRLIFAIAVAMVILSTCWIIFFRDARMYEYEILSLTLSFSIASLIFSFAMLAWLVKIQMRICAAGSFCNSIGFVIAMVINYALLMLTPIMLIMSKTITLILFGTILSRPYGMSFVNSYLKTEMNALQYIEYSLNIIMNYYVYKRGMLYLILHPWNALKAYYSGSLTEPVSFIEIWATVLPNTIRFLISIIFFGSFVLRPLLTRPTSYVWARLLEASETKPIFAMIFGGVAALATAGNELGKHFWAS